MGGRIIAGVWTDASEPRTRVALSVLNAHVNRGEKIVVVARCPKVGPPSVEFLAVTSHRRILLLHDRTVTPVATPDDLDETFGHGILRVTDIADEPVLLWVRSPAIPAVRRALSDGTTPRADEGRLVQVPAEAKGRLAVPMVVVGAALAWWGLVTFGGDVAGDSSFFRGLWDYGRVFGGGWMFLLGCTWLDHVGSRP